MLASTTAGNLRPVAAPRDLAHRLCRAALPVLTYPSTLRSGSRPAAPANEFAGRAFCGVFGSHATILIPWAHEPITSSAGRVDSLLGAATWLAVLAWLGGLGWLLFREWPRRRRPEPAGRRERYGALGLAGGCLVGIVLFVQGLTGYVDLRTPPKDALEIRVTGQKWRWLFTYPNGLTDDVLHVPLDTSIRLLVSSNDVVHSLYVPALRAKVEAIPGRVTDLWFRSSRPGEFPIVCAEYCGSSYFAMRTRLVVHGPGGYDKWLDAREKDLLERPPADLGRLVAERQGCLMCHTIWGGDSVGPTLLKLYGTRRPLSDGSSVVADDKYIRESTLDPNRHLVAGYAAGMPSYQGKLSGQELTGIIEYLKTLK
jgi:cytochrome c oxidase subunit 2